MKAVLKYPGAKHRLADWICGYIPDHDVYLEPFAGSLAVLFNKSPCHIETVNDLDSNIVNFYKVLRENPEELKRLIESTPWARDEYNSAYEDTEDNVEQARRFCVRCWMGFGCGNLYRNGFKSGQQTKSPNPARAWHELPETLQKVTERLQNVQIENLPAIELINRYDTEDVFIYLDPPYLLDVRKNYLYKHEMSDEEHIRLLKLIREHPGKILLSGYDNKLYDELLLGWEKVHRNTVAEGGKKRVETLWMNYEPVGKQYSFIN